MDALLLQFQGFVLDLTTVEKRNIVALTEIARDALRTQPQAAPSLAALITNRALQAPANVKLPVLYLLDSIAKIVGAPYTTYFAASLPDVFSNAWAAGAPGLHRPLEKLLATWPGVFPQETLDAVRLRLAQPVGPGPEQYGWQNGGGGHGAYAPPGHKPMMLDPRLSGPYAYQAMQPQYGQPPQHAYLPAQQPYPYDYLAPPPGAYAAAPAVAYPPQQPYRQQPYQQQPPYQLSPPGTVYGPPGAPAYDVASYLPPSYQQPLAAPGYQQPAMPVAGYQQPESLLTAGQPPPQLPAVAPAAAPAQLPQAPPLPDLLSSLMTSGLLAAPGGKPSAAVPVADRTQKQGRVTLAAALGSPASVEFSAERIKESNPAAVRRLLSTTEATKTKFLDRKFLRRQKAGSGLRLSRMWYVDLDTWMASTSGDGAARAAAGAGRGGGGEAGGAAAEAPAKQEHSVPADDEQALCALSGERFELYWDEGHQEWRYRDAKRLDAQEAAAHGLPEGALVLVSALGAPRTAPQPAAAVAAAVAPAMQAEPGAANGIKGEAAGEAAAEAAQEEPAAKRVKLEHD